MLVCHCTVVNDRRIRELVDEGAVDLLDIASACGAGSFCGGCVPTIASLLSHATGEPTSAILDRAPSRVDDDTSTLPTRVRQVVRAIEEDVLGGGWVAGARVPDEDELARRHGASRQVVRDALTVLRHHGVLRPEDGAALVVTHPDLALVGDAAALHLQAAGVTPDEVVQTRQVVEGLAVTCACAHPDEAAWQQFVAATRTTDAEPPIDLHRALPAVAGNPALALFDGVLARLTPAVSTVHAAEEHAEVAAAITQRDGEAAAAALAAHLHALAEAVAAHADTRSLAAPAAGTEPPTDPLAIARALLDLVQERGIPTGEVIGTERELADQLGVDRRTLRATVPVLEYHALATLQPGPRATLTVATPDPWPAAELLALALDRADATPGQLLHVRQALEVRAVELASHHIDDRAAARLRRRLDEEATVVQRDRVQHPMFHTIHPLLAQLSGNRALAGLAIATSMALVRRANRDPDLARFLSSGVGEVATAHTAIVDAATRGAAETSRRLMDAHVARHAVHAATAD